MDVTVFSAAGCGGCVSTKYQLKTRNIPFSEVRVDQSPEALEAFKRAGFSQVPVVMAHRHEGDEVPDIWTGFHSDFVGWLLDPSVPIPDLYENTG